MPFILECTRPTSAARWRSLSSCRTAGAYPRNPVAALGPICCGHAVVSDNPDREFGAVGANEHHWRIMAPPPTQSGLRPSLRYVCASAYVCVNALCRGERPDRRYRIGADRMLAKAPGQVRTWGLTGSKPAPLANSFSVCP